MLISLTGLCLSTVGTAYSPSTKEQAFKELNFKTFIIIGISVGALIIGVTIAMIIYKLHVYRKGEVLLVNIDYDMSVFVRNFTAAYLQAYIDKVID